MAADPANEPDVRTRPWDNPANDNHLCRGNDSWINCSSNQEHPALHTVPSDPQQPCCPPVPSQSYRRRTISSSSPVSLQHRWPELPICNISRYLDVGRGRDANCLVPPVGYETIQSQRSLRLGTQTKLKFEKSNFKSNE